MNYLLNTDVQKAFGRWDAANTELQRLQRSNKKADKAMVVETEITVSKLFAQYKAAIETAKK